MTFLGRGLKWAAAAFLADSTCPWFPIPCAMHLDWEYSRVTLDFLCREEPYRSMTLSLALWSKLWPCALLWPKWHASPPRKYFWARMPPFCCHGLWLGNPKLLVVMVTSQAVPPAWALPSTRSIRSEHKVNLRYFKSVRATGHRLSWLPFTSVSNQCIWKIVHCFM
jgi:hypothetical protein